MMTILPTETLDGVRYYHSGHEDGLGRRTYLLVHGLGTSLDFWHVVAPSLASSSEVVAFDVPGFGQSVSPPGRYDLDSVAQRTAKFIDLLGHRDMIVVGHSLGALL